MLLKIEHDGSVAGQTAMERDLYLLSKSEELGTIFRTYMWETPTISVGRLQNPNEILDLERMRKKHIELVTRPTGGRQILHGHDISFSLIIPTKHLINWGKTVSERNIRLSFYIEKAFSILNIPLGDESQELSRKTLIRQKKAPCFLTTAPAELSYKGKKLVGVAQLVHAHGVLIQGTIPLNRFHSLLPMYERIPLHEQKRLNERLLNETSNLSDICRIPPNYSEICRAFSEVFSF